jgi:hypothetical protein
MEKKTMAEENQNQRSFNPREHLLQLKSREGSKDYLPVQWRLVWFREQCPQGTIETEIVHLDLDKEMDEETFAWNSEKRRSEKVVKTARGVAIVRAVVRDGKGGVATGTKMEKAASFPDWLEKAETGAIGRALAALGYGTQFAPDLDEAHRIVDAPVDRSSNEPPAPEPTPAQPTSIVRAPEPAVRSLPSASVSPQNKALLDMLSKSKATAQRLGVDWDEEKALVLKNRIADKDLTAQQIGLINADLAKARGDKAS